jgi:hypothetical protein
MPAKMAPKKQNKKQQHQKKKADERSFKVENLKDRLQARGEVRVVDERMLSNTRVLSRIKSASELDSLFARKPRSVVWLSDSVYMYKRSLVRNSCNLLDFLEEMNGVRFHIFTKDAAGKCEEHSFELHWDNAERSNFDVTSSVGSFVRILSRDVTITTVWWRNLRPGLVSLPVDTQALACFFGTAASTRKVNIEGIFFKRNQCPALFSSKDGSVVILEFDLGASLLDRGLSLHQALKKSIGVTELDLIRVHQAPEDTFKLVMRGLYKNRLVHRLKIARSILGDIHVKALCAVVRRSKHLKNLDLGGCKLTGSQWKNLWASIKVNTSIATINICDSLPYSPAWVRFERDNDVEDAIRENQTLEVILHNRKNHLSNFWDKIQPYLAKNRVRKRARAVAVEACQGKRWALLGKALCHNHVRSNPGVTFAFLKTSLDSFVMNAPTGKEILVQQLKKLDQQRAAVQDKLRAYEESEQLASRKRQAPGLMGWLRKKARA